MTTILKQTFLIIFCLMGYGTHGQYAKIDSLWGSVTPERAWWDLTFYDLEVQVAPDQQFISGTNMIHYTVLKEGVQTLQIELQKPMRLLEALQDGERLKVEQNELIHYIALNKKQKEGAKEKVEIKFSGHPHVALRPPWDGGFSWNKDNNGHAFIATSNQGIGSSIWWPNKDHPYDEVDSLQIAVTVPKNLVDVSNGNLRKVETLGDKKKYTWFVSNPINSYGVNINIADYASWTDTYKGEKGDLNLSFYVLKDHLEVAKVQFLQTHKMLEAFEYWFGPYPFYEDGFKLVEVPYLGMEHQSSVTYGNGFKNGYRGTDLSHTGWGLQFDFIIIHEAGHEWFANNITNKDVADMWLHEGFTAYSENLYLDYHFGKKASSEYVIGTRKNIANDRPLIGDYNVRADLTSDIYYKGANILHTLRQLLEDDEKWRSILRGLNQEFYHQTVSSWQVENYISQKSNIDLTDFFDQYLRTVDIPVLEFKIENGRLHYRYQNTLPQFDMPVAAQVNGEKKWFYPKKNGEWQVEDLNTDSILWDENLYVIYKKVI